MSWKSLVTAGLLCVLASPAFAAPALSITSGGLNATGNFVWNVQISNSNPVPNLPAGTSLAAELGFAVTGGLTSASNLSTGAGDDFDTSNPGTAIFGWETLTYVDPGAGVNNKAVGLQTSVANNQVYSALGSQVYTTVGPHDYIQIIGTKPTSTNLTSAVTVSGKYGTGSAQGRIAEGTGAGTAANYAGFVGTATRTLKAGDATLNGTVDVGDLAVLGANYNQSGKIWSTADFTGNGTVDVGDLAVLGANYNQSGGANTPLNVTGVPGGSGSGVGAGAGVPEPASIALMGLALRGGMGLFGRKR